MCNLNRFWHALARGLLLAGLLALAAGCSSKGKVSGKVYYKNEPLKLGMVQFFPEGQGGAFSSPIGEDGSYSVSKLPPGPVKISVTSSSANPMAQLNPAVGGPMAQKGMKGAAEMMKKGKEQAGDAAPPSAAGGKTIPAKYGSPETSDLSLNVTGGSQTFDIKLD
jgi:hypothetical protein